METRTTAPYLDDDKAQFRMSFEFFDAALSTSEIKPLHLKLPGKRNTPKIFRSPDKRYSSSAPLNSLINQNSQDKYEDAKDSVNRISLSETSDKLAARPRNRKQSSMLNKSTELFNTGTHSSFSREKFQSTEILTPPKESLLGISQSQETIDKNFDPFSDGKELTFSGLYFLPCSPKQTINMTFKINDDGRSSIIYSLFLPADLDKIQRLSAHVYGRNRGARIELFFGDKMIGELRYNALKKYQNVCMTGLSPPAEICAILLNSNPKLQYFDLVIPALKKINGRYQSFCVDIREDSMLVEYVSRMAKESIRMKMRLPTQVGDTYDTTFDGKLSLPGANNFILYHESNHKRDVMTFGKFDDTTYNIVCGYPLSPIQAFAAAIAASLPS